MDAAIVLNAISTFALVTALVFGAVQLVLLRRSRQDQQAIEMVRATQTPEWVRAATIVLFLPPGLSPKQVDERGPGVLEAVRMLGIYCETEGYMVFRRTIPLTLVDDLHGGVVRGAWARLQHFIDDDREATGNARAWEWFQWLAERLEESHRPERAVGAYISHRDWRP